jgi:hypothetical protein
MRRTIAGSLALALLAFAALVFADEVLVLKDGRRIPVTRLARRGGQVVFQTTRGEVFSVPEGDVASPPLASIAVDESKLLILKDGRRLTVTRLARRGGLVLFTTTRNEAFSTLRRRLRALRPRRRRAPRSRHRKPSSLSWPRPPLPRPRPPRRRPRPRAPRRASRSSCRFPTAGRSPTRTAHGS